MSKRKLIKRMENNDNSDAIMKQGKEITIKETVYRFIEFFPKVPQIQTYMSTSGLQMFQYVPVQFE